VSARPNSRKLTALGRVGAGLGVSAVAFYQSGRGADWTAIPGYIGRADWLLIAAGAAVLLVSLGLFAARWRALIPEPAVLQTRRAFSCLMVGYLVNTVLPLRLGDAARLGLASRRFGLGLSLLAGALAVERLMDLAILAAAGVGLGLVMTTPRLLGSGLVFVLGLALAGLAALWVLALTGDWLDHAKVGAGRGRRAVAAAWAGRQLAGFQQGLWALRGPARVGQAGGLSALAWVGIALATGLWTRAFGLPVPWYGVVLLVVAVNLGAILPSAPAGVGIYHLAVILVLTTWVADRELALAYAVSSHGVNSALNIVAGLGCLLAEGAAGPASPSGAAQCSRNPG